MIGDSVRWKAELLRIADRLERRRNQKRWTEQTFFLVERDIMVAAYAIRKLTEAGKLSDRQARQRVYVIRLPQHGSVPDRMNYQYFWQHYDLNTEECLLKLGDFCNQIIHSFNWFLVRPGVFFSSDWAKSTSLYFADLGLLISLLRDLADDNHDMVAMTKAQNDARKSCKWLTDIPPLQPLGQQ